MGIKGVGMATLAVMCKQAGFIVGGSDIDQEFITDKILKDAGIEVKIGFKQDNVRDFFGSSNADCLFVATGAHSGFDNEEAREAKNLGIRVISHGEAVGYFMNGEPFGRSDTEGVSIAGAHGKTTISGMVATVLSGANLDPSFTVGTSEIFPLGPAGHYGLGRYFVAEADEYLSESNHDRTAKFLHQKPTALIINNIDFDHPDFYKDIEAVEEAYLEFAQNVPANGLIVANGDDTHTKNVITKLTTGVRVVTFGAGESNDFVVSGFVQEGPMSHFTVKNKDVLIGRFSLSVPGYHNAKNATAVIALLIELGLGVDKIGKNLQNFQGTKRRMEIVGKTQQGQTIIDDYAHHPEEISKTLSALKLEYPGSKIVTVFQFHTFSRTKALFDSFVSSFSQASKIIIVPTFASQRDEAAEENYDKKMVDALVGIGKEAILMPADSVVEYVNANLNSPNVIILTMGAGDVYRIGYKLKI